MTTSTAQHEQLTSKGENPAGTSGGMGTDKPASRLQALQRMACKREKKFDEFRFGPRVAELKAGLDERQKHLDEIKAAKILPIERQYWERVRSLARTSRDKIACELKCHEDSLRRRERYKEWKAKSDSRLAKLREKYPVEISVAAFENKAFWRTDRTDWGVSVRVPRLVIFNTDSAGFSVQSKAEETRYSTYRRLEARDLPAFLRRCFYRFHHSCAEVFSKESSVQLSAEFGGAIPLKVKEKIAAAREDFGDSIFVIAEVPDLKVNVQVTMPRGDPLVVGAAGHRLFLITDFDTTSLEREYLFKLPGEK